MLIRIPVMENHMRKHRLSLVLLTSCLLAGCASDNHPQTDTTGFAHIAEQLRAKGDDVGAADMYDRALQKSPGDVTARLGLGAILEAHGELTTAERYYTEGLKVTPDN